MRIAGLDLGADQITSVVVDETGQVLTRSEEARGEGLGTSAQAALRNATGNTPADAIGVTIGYDVDQLSSDVRAGLGPLGESAVTTTSGQALVLAESWCGAARGLANVVTFAIGDHVVAGILINGQLLQGANGYAGSVAWLALNPVEREDYRRHGGLEAEVAASGIVRRLVWRIKSGDRSRVTERVNGELARLTSDHVFAAAREGDGVCLSVVRDTAKYVGMAIANLATVVDPECVVLGGTLASAGDLMLDAIRTEASRRLRPAQSERTAIVLSTLGGDAAAIGAARAALLQRQPQGR